MPSEAALRRSTAAFVAQPAFPGLPATGPGPRNIALHLRMFQLSGTAGQVVRASADASSRPYPSFCNRGESCREALRYQESHLLDLFTKAPLRIAYDCSQKPFRAQFLCSLSRAAEAEASLGLGFRVLTRSSMPMSTSQSHAHPSLVERPAKWSKALNTRFAKFCHHGYHSHRSLQVSLCYAPRLT